MSGIIGKKNSTLKKQTVTESKLLETGVKNLKFWHEASAGDKSIPFGSLSLPADILAAGLTNPTSTEILSANLGFFKENVEVRSSVNNDLMIGLTFVVQNNQIKFVNGYEALDGEVFEVKATNNVVTGNNIVDARAITATGTLTAGQTEFVVGEAWKTGAYATEQIGEVLVFVDGEVQYRNVGNATANPAADGNYEEVHAANGYGSVIKFNEPYITDQPIIVISRNLIAERPNLSMLQFIETLGGQLDKVISTVAALAGVDEDEFQVAPNHFDLKAFGEQVLLNKQAIAQNAADIELKQDAFQIDFQVKTLNSDVTVNTADITDIKFVNLEIGKYYRIRGQAAWVADNADNPNLIVRHDGVALATSVPGLTLNGQIIKHAIVSPVFQATTTTVISEVTAMDALNLLQGNGTFGETWLELEELPNHNETGKWS